MSMPSVTTVVLSNHSIVAHTMTPVSAIIMDGEMAILEDPSQEAITIYGCDDCGCSLDQAISTPCEREVI